MVPATASPNPASAHDAFCLMTPSATARVAERHAPRIRLRFTLLFATTILIVLLASAAAVRLMMHRALDREFEASTRASAALVAQFFRVEIAEYQTIDATVAHIASELVFEDRMIHVMSPDGTEFGVVGSPAPHRHRTLLPPVRTVTVPLDAQLAPRWTIQVQASGASIAAVEARIDRWLALGIPMIVVLAAALGWWLTGRTLRPVGRMADASARIEPGTGGRLPIDDPDDELGRLGTRFNALLDRLDGALDQQRRFIGDAAHELRTPLARLRSRVDVALQSPGADVLPAVERDIVRMSTLVDELLQLARVDAGRDQPLASMQAIYLDDLVTDELRHWQEEARLASVELTCTMLQESSIDGDPVLLARLIGILLDNALRYSTSGGRVDVRVSTERGLVTLDVEDNGIGMSDEERSRVFERFYRGERARARRSDGSGLGLAIAKWIAEAHRGTIRVSPASRGEGTLVTVQLPERPPA